MKLVVILALAVVLLLGLTYRDYREYRRPLTEIDPYVHYTFFHHFRIVIIAKLRYRLTNLFHKS